MSYPVLRKNKIPMLRLLIAAVFSVGSLAALPSWGNDINAAHTPAESIALARDVLKDLVAAKSVHSRGSTHAAQMLAERFLAAGFAKEDVQLLTPKEFPSKGNLVVRLRGSGKAKPILYIGHLDVVEAKPEDWNLDPFTLNEKDGWLYGRGVIDMLGQDTAMLVSLIRLKKEGYVPDRDIVLALTADEEAEGNSNGVEWLLKEHRPLVDAAMVINPDAGEAGIKNGRKLYISMETSEKVFLTFTAEVTDKGGHSSRPTDQNPIYRLSKGLNRLSAYEFPLHLTDTVKLYFSGRSALESGQKKQDMLAVSGAKIDKSAAMRLSKEVETNILMRTTCVTTEISGGHAENALPQRARATIQCRVIPGESQAEVQKNLARVLNDTSIKITVATPAKPSPESTPTPAIRQAVESVTNSMWKNVAILPTMAAGASDSIYTRSAGIPTYGIDAMFDDLDDGRAHGRDERINVKVFDEELEFTYRLMKAIDKLPK